MRVLVRNRPGLLGGFCFFAASLIGAPAAQAQAPASSSPAASSQNTSGSGQAAKPVQSKPAQSKPAQNQAAQAAKPQAANPQTTKPQASAGAAGQRTAQAKREPIKEPVTSRGCARVPGKPYFVEFRSRTAASYGHTFVFFGTIGGGKSFANFKVAGLHPKGDDPATYIQGHWAPVEAETGVSYGDLDEQFLTARFCVPLNQADFNRAVAYIRNLQATTKTWHAPTYNCNSFAADIAKHIGLDTPNPNAYLPETFIKRLAEDNSRKKDGSAFPSFSFMQGGGATPAR
jgi:hypothetical protein